MRIGERFQIDTQLAKAADLRAATDFPSNKGHVAAQLFRGADWLHLTFSLIDTRIKEHLPRGT